MDIGQIAEFLAPLLPYLVKGGIEAGKAAAIPPMYPQLYSWDNLLLAYHKAAKGKRGQPNVAAFEYRLEDNLLQLQRELLAKTYRPGEYHSFYIHDPKKRLISAAVQGWVNHVRYADTWNLRRALLSLPH